MIRVSEFFVDYISVRWIRMVVVIICIFLIGSYFCWFILFCFKFRCVCIIYIIIIKISYIIKICSICNSIGFIIYLSMWKVFFFCDEEVDEGVLMFLDSDIIWIFLFIILCFYFRIVEKIKEYRIIIRIM